MAKYTENFSLIKPDDEDYYDVADFNENMDIIDEALALSVGGAEATDKIGQPEDSILSTVFGKLNGFISEDGQGVRIIKSLQKIEIPFTSANQTIQKPISPVNPEKCFVYFTRLYDRANGSGKITYTLASNSLSVTHTIGAQYEVLLNFWIIEFY